MTQADLPDLCQSTLEEALPPNFFKALCDPVRISIVATLATKNKPSPVSEIAECCGIDFSGVSRHLKILKEAGILTAEKQGRSVFYALRSEHVATSLRAMADAIEMCRAESN